MKVQAVLLQKPRKQRSRMEHAHKCGRIRLADRQSAAPLYFALFGLVAGVCIYCFRQPSLSRTSVNGQASTKFSLPTPQTGQTQSSGISSKGVPGAMPPSGSPTAGSYSYPQISQTNFFIIQKLVSFCKDTIFFKKRCYKAIY